MHDYSSLKINPLDPLIAEWAEDVLARLRHFDEDAFQVFADRVFPPPVLESLLKPDSPHSPKILYRLLPRERFAPFTGEMIERWPSVPRGEVSESSKLIAQLDPDKAAAMFEEFARSENFVRDPVRAEGAIAGAAYLPREKAARLVPLLFEVVEKSDDETFRRTLSAPLAILSSLIRDDNMGEAIERIQKADSRRLDPGELLRELFKNAAGELPFYDLASGIRRGWTDQTFSSLSSIFQEGAPLAELDELCSEPPARAVEKALALFPSGDTRLAGIARSVAGISRHSGQAEWREANLFLVLGLLAASYFKDPGDFPGWDLERLLDYVTADLSPLPGIHEAAERLKEFDSAAAAILARRSEYLGDDAAANLSWIMMLLNRPEFIPALLEYLGDDDYQVCEMAMNALSRLGEPALAEIVSRWGNLSEDQKNYGLGVIENVGGEAAVDFLVSIAPDENVDEEQWCNVAQSVPDPRLLKFVEPQLHRGLFCFDETFLTILALNGLDHHLREEVRIRWEKERKRQQEIIDNIRLEDYIHPDNEFVKMELECTLCGKRGVYEAGAVYISRGGGGQDALIAGERPCIFCGGFPEFKITEDGLKAVTSELVNLTLAQNAGRPYDGPLRIDDTRMFNGKVVPIPVAIAAYLKLIEKDPRDATLRIGLGNIYRFLEHFRKAKEQYWESIRLDPSYLEASLALSGILYDEEKFEESFTVLEKALECKNSWKFCRLGSNSTSNLLLAFLDDYNDLRKILDRPGGRLEMRDLYPSTVKKAGKIGRNDPCPCGSGKNTRNAVSTNKIESGVQVSLISSIRRSTTLLSFSVEINNRFFFSPVGVTTH